MLGFHLLGLSCLLVLTKCAYLSPRIKRSTSVQEVVDAFWDWRLKESPEFGTKYKLYTHETDVEEYTETSMERKMLNATSLLEYAESVDVSQLKFQDKITIKILKHLLDTYIKGYEYRVYGAYNPLGTMYNPLNDFTDMVSRMKFETVTDYNNWLTRLEKLPKTFTDMIILMDKAIEEGKTLNVNSLTGVVEKFDAVLSQNNSQMNYYKPFDKIPTTIPIVDRQLLKKRAQSVLNDEVLPSIQNMRNYIVDVYTQNTRPEIGVSSLPGGLEFYQACLDWHLSVHMTPSEVFQKGIEEVARIKGEMEKIMRAEGFKGTLKEYIESLKQDPNNYYQTEEEFLEGYKSLVNRITSKIQTAFTRSTEIELKIEKNPNRNGPLARYTEPSADGATPGIFKANVFDANHKAKFDMMAVTLHETYPGHHLQVGYAIEEEMPYFRRLIEYRKYYAVPFNWPFFTAYIEGWGLYAEKLGETDSLDLYKDRKELFGRYTSEIFRASRLVIDTGIHVFNWTKQQAKDYLAEYTTLADTTIENEINRYITWPGQATSYKIGELKIVELRQKAETGLGDKFDLKQFHKVVLDLGPAPLTFLEEAVDNWIQETTSRGSAVHVSMHPSTIILTTCVLITRFFL